MTNYTLVCYRPDYWDECDGSSTSSSFTLVNSTDVKDIAFGLEGVLYDEWTPVEGEVYAQYETHFMVNGVPTALGTIYDQASTNVKVRIECENAQKRLQARSDEIIKVQRQLAEANRVAKIAQKRLTSLTGEE